MSDDLADFLTAWDLSQYIDTFREKIKKTKEHSINQILKDYVQLGAEDNEEASNISAFLCLPFLIGVTISRSKKTKLQWKLSKLEMRDGFITHVRSNAEVQETISRKQEKLLGLGHTQQPFIIIVGPTLSEISNYFVVVDDVFYQLNSILAAVDCCFKTTITFNAEYPVECETICKVVDIVLSTSLEENSCFLLETLIGEMNELYIKYSKNTLKPKFHFLTHYPLIIRKFGPVVHFWSMRYEAKHRISKISARSSFNRRNICKTLAIKHQLQLNDIFTKFLLCNNLVIGPSKILHCSKYNLIKSELNLSTEETLIRISWAELKGTRYKVNSILTRDLDDDNPQFVYSVKNIYMYGSENIIFECNLLNTVGFNEHLHAFEIEIPVSNMCFIYQDSLISPIPNTLNVTPDGVRYVTVRDPL
ncbi:unnamed protein product [Macrosiphum euphorbiae]|uniref:Uncharacterized protein n=1 Tax=Macrosiphum euphorbiae TaxID=13131 RepID=A0AAV0XWD1_9HEMI|nr:unnamed protein product [Macrosiphum euphorbiae]